MMKISIRRMKKTQNPSVSHVEYVGYITKTMKTMSHGNGIRLMKANGTVTQHMIPRGMMKKVTMEMKIGQGMIPMKTTNTGANR